MLSTNEQGAVTTTHGTTTFQDDGAVNKTVTRATELYKGIKPFDVQAISDFMAKPQIFANFTWTTAQAFETQLFAGSISSLMESKATWTNKLEGYKLVRGTAVVKVVINANPFQQGKLICSFQPCYRHLPTWVQSSKNQLMSQITTAPNVELDASETSFEMRIPYVTPNNWYDRVSTLFDWGTFFLHVLSPLEVGSAGETEVDVNIFMSFEDFELAAPYSAESSLSKLSTVPKVSRAIRVEKNAASKGSISGPSEVVADEISHLGSLLSFIPGSEYVSGVASGVLRSVSNIAAVFGFSKPMVVNPAQEVINFPFKYLNNSSGSNPAPVFAYSHDHKSLTDPSIYGHNLDEMSFSYLKTIPGLFRIIPWTTSDVHNTELFSFDVSPATLMSSKVNTKGFSNIRMRAGSPMFMIHRQFGMYRGGIKLTIKFAKTAFHSGRLVVTFVPIPGTSPSIDAGVLSLREVIDLKESDSVTLRLPYLYGENFLNLLGDTHDGIDSIGTLSIRVLGELRAPETCSTSVNMLLYAQPDDDFEYAGFGYADQVGFSPESALYNSSHLQEKGIGNSKSSDEGMQPNSISFSDPVLSVKHLLNISRNFFAKNVNIGSNNKCRLNPSSLSLAKNDLLAGGIPLMPDQAIFGDPINFLSTGYAFCRGGYRITCFSTTFSTQTWIVPQGPSEASASIPSNNGPNINQSLLLKSTPIIPSAADRGITDVVTPGWQRGNFRLNKYYFDALPSPVNRGAEDYPYSIEIRTLQGSNLPLTGWTRSVADDFTLGYFVGFTPYVVPDGQ